MTVRPQRVRSPNTNHSQIQAASTKPQMRLLVLTRLSSSTLLLLLLASLSQCVHADSGQQQQQQLYPPTLQPLINRANVLLTSGQFTEAARLYSEAIEQSPSDYLLYYKRATAYMSLSKHAAALEDFDRVLSLTSMGSDGEAGGGNTFDLAYLMKARIHTRDGSFDLAKSSLDLYKSARQKLYSSDAFTTIPRDVDELETVIDQGKKLREKADKERRAQLWNACVETTSSLLGTASHSIEVREWRAECALAAGDVESTVGDLTRLTHLQPSSTPLLSRIFRLSYFYLPPSPITTQNTLKQCLHFDPDSKPCLSLRRLAKSLDKGFAKLDSLLENSDWRGVVRLVLEKGKENKLLERFDDAVKDNTRYEDLVGPLTDGKKKALKIPLPDAFKTSPHRQTLIRALCKAYTALADGSKSDLDARRSMGKYCDELLSMPGLDSDLDGLVGRAEFLLAQSDGGEDGKWEEATRLLEKAFEASERSDKKVYQRLNKAMKMMKQSKQKDYYKVLGVQRDADERTIKKAFRRAAKSAHPDKGGSEAKMAALNEAYKVLSDPELRARFDAGDDPNDPMGGQGAPFQGSPFGGGGASYTFHGFPGGGSGGFGGQHPFAQFFQGGGQGGGGGQQFKFHFG